jgi:hypothetical protein
MAKKHIVGHNDVTARLGISSDMLSVENLDVDVVCGTPWASVEAAEGTLAGAACNTATKHSQKKEHSSKATHTGKTTKQAGSDCGLFHQILSIVWNGRKQAQFRGVLRGICEVTEIVRGQCSSRESIVVNA